MHAPVYLILFDMLLLTLWSFSLYGQTSADYSDPNHPSRWPWYVTRKCSRRLLPSDLELGGGLDEEEWRCCVLAKVFLGVSGNLLVLYAARLVWCVYKTITCGWKKKTSTSRIKSRIADKPRTQKNRPDHGPKDEETGK
ncbi:hypothetical protein BDW74DRAFT_161495 [Aspergillus multicolor]|uniref:uncharacterized protein n=1 Tax=Aspergillus multicolor TaxID=41759 RepID=UPI003CCD880B